MVERVERTILVVDDNPATLYTTARVLRSVGFQVLEAANGTQALEHAREGVDLVVLDVNLPDIDGFEVCRRLRASERTARVPVLHLSATFVKDVDKVHGLEAGADGYLTHPVEPPVLVATVAAFLRARSAEEEMRRSEVKFRAVFDHALSGIALLNHDLHVLEVNPAMTTLLGRDQSEIVGRPLVEFVAPDHQSKVADIVRHLQQQRGWRGILPVVQASHGIVHLEWHVSIHALPGVRLALATDITERIRTEEQRKELLASERAARSDAERANRLKDEFLATLSHELRTPLNAIVGWSQMLQQRKLKPAQVVEGLETIERNAKVQTQLISDLLDVSRITSGKMRLDMQVVDPAGLVEAALGSITATADAKGLQIVKRLAATAGPVLGDASRLQQVIWNLMSNAVKFTPKGGRIDIEVSRVESCAQIRVADSGQGIKSEFLPFLFDRFRQGDATAARAGGLGIGLAIVKHLIEMHGGTVTAESPGEGLGSTFTVRLPVAPMKALRDSRRPDQYAASIPFPESELPLKGVRVMVVDDDADARILLQRVLAECEAQVHAADSVEHALSAIPDFQPHVLVSDIGMPGRDGYDLIREVRSRGYTFQSLPAIALTAFARSEERRRALLAGYQVHVAKPVDTSELIAAIATLIGRTGAAPRP